MTILRWIPNDGTFDQPAPLVHLFGKAHCYSFDLKSATDRWPLHYLYTVMMMFFGPSLASSVVNTTLGFNTFDVLFVKIKRCVSFIAGKPWGYYASWPLFSLSHHILVWYAAEQVHPGVKFTAYAILGDDIVIGDTDVAMVYAQCLEKLGVDISKNKYIILNTGAFEFAKRFHV
jgi:hypothetical protein